MGWVARIESESWATDVLRLCAMIDTSTIEPAAASSVNRFVILSRTIRRTFAVTIGNSRYSRTSTTDVQKKLLFAGEAPCRKERASIPTPSYRRTAPARPPIPPTAPATPVNAWSYEIGTHLTWSSSGPFASNHSYP
jgi:hypothetical protein